MSSTLVKFELRGAKKGRDTCFFDESHQHVLHQRSNGFYTVALRGIGVNEPPIHGVLERPMSCQLARVSLDGSVLAVQVSNVLVLVVEIDGTKRWRIKVRSGLMSRLVVSGFVDRVVAGMMAPGNDDKEQCVLLPGGIVWTNHGGTSQDLMLVTTRGMELYKVSCSRGQCQAVRNLTFATHFFRYAASARLIVLGTGPFGRELRPYWLRREISNLPKFELPPPERVQKLVLTSSQHTAATYMLDPRDVHLVCCYGQANILHRASPAYVDVYVVRKDHCELARRLQVDLGGPWFASTDDDLLLVHIVTARLSLVFDLEGSIEPFVKAHVVAGSCSRDFADDRFYDVRQTFGPSACLGDQGSIYDIHCNLSVLIKRATQPIACIASLLRRGVGIADTLCGAITIRRVIALVINFCAKLLHGHHCAILCDVLRLISAVEGRHVESSIVFIALDQLDFLRRIVMCVSTQFPARAVVDGLLIYLDSRHRAQISIDAVLSVIIIRALAFLGEYSELVQLLQYKVLPDTPPVADAVVSADGAALGQLGYDMLSRLNNTSPGPHHG